MKREILSAIYLFCSLAVFGQTASEGVVRQFGNNLQAWCSTKETILYRARAQSQCTDACRVIDVIMKDVASKKKIDMSIKENCEIPSYLNIFEDALDEGAVSFAMSNIRTISNNEQSYSFSYGKGAKQEAKRSKDFITVACDISVSGASMNYHIKDLYYIQKGKIVKITPYEEVIDQRTGKKKVKVDFSDLMDEDEGTFGISYNYGQHFPVGASITGSRSWFMVGLDFGMTFDKDEVISDEMEIKDLNNFKRTKGTYKPKYFVTATPAIYLKYVSIGCGVGGLFMRGTEEKTEYHSTQAIENSNNGSSSSISGGGSTIEKSAEKVKFMLRPILRGYIPLNDEWQISAGIGYDYVFGYKDKNGVNFSLGLNYRIDW